MAGPSTNDLSTVPREALALHPDEVDAEALAIAIQNRSRTMRYGSDNVEDNDDSTITGLLLSAVDAIGVTGAEGEIRAEIAPVDRIVREKGLKMQSEIEALRLQKVHAHFYTVEKALS